MLLIIHDISTSTVLTQREKHRQQRRRRQTDTKRARHNRKHKRKHEHETVPKQNCAPFDLVHNKSSVRSAKKNWNMRVHQFLEFKCMFQYASAPDDWCATLFFCAPDRVELGEIWADTRMDMDRDRFGQTQTERPDGPADGHTDGHTQRHELDGGHVTSRCVCGLRRVEGHFGRSGGREEST